MKNTKLYTCLGCGFKVFKGVFTEYEICPICRYQDTSGGVNHPFISSFKHGISLINYQQESIQKYPLDIKKLKLGKKEFIRNNLWKTIKIKYLDKNYGYLPDWKYKEYIECYPNSNNYDLLFKEAQENNSDERLH